MLVRYTRQLATAALIVAAGLGMGACSAHPGAAVVSSSGSYSNEEVAQAAQQMSVLMNGQQISDSQIRSQLVNLPLLEAAGASVGAEVSDEQIDQIAARAAIWSICSSETSAPTEAPAASRSGRFTSCERICESLICWPFMSTDICWAACATSSLEYEPDELTTAAPGWAEHAPIPSPAATIRAAVASWRV